MSTREPDDPNPPHPPPAEPEYAPDLVALRDRLAEDGVTLRIPRLRAGANWSLPEPVEVEGENASDIIIRWRHEP